MKIDIERLIDAVAADIRPGSAGYIKRSEALGWLINV